MKNFQNGDIFFTLDIVSTKDIWPKYICCFWKLQQLWLIGNRTCCHWILSVIILMINKLDSRLAVIQFFQSLVWLQIKLDSTQSYYHYKLAGNGVKNLAMTWKLISIYLVTRINFSILLRLPALNQSPKTFNKHLTWWIFNFILLQIFYCRSRLNWKVNEFLYIS